MCISENWRCTGFPTYGAYITRFYSNALQVLVLMGVTKKPNSEVKGGVKHTISGARRQRNRMIHDIRTRLTATQCGRRGVPLAR